MKLNLEINKIIELIGQKKLKTILIQLPDGLKPKAKDIDDMIKSEFNNKVKIYFWLNSCFGACDVHTNKLLSKFKIDEIIQLGHAEWR